MSDARGMSKGYAVCGVARSGTTYLCELLRSTNLLGRPTEVFNHETFPNVPDYPREPVGQLQAIPTHGVTPNGVYGLKVLTHQFESTVALRWVERLPKLSFVYLQRRDVLGLAISAYRAQVSGAWVSTAPVKVDPPYDPTWINNGLINAIREQARWRYWFAHNGLTPLELIYEDVVANPQGAVDAVAAMMGVEGARIDFDRVEWLRIQRDETTEAWRDRFLVEQRNLGSFH